MSDRITDFNNNKPPVSYAYSSVNLDYPDGYYPHNIIHDMAQDIRRTSTVLLSMINFFSEPEQSTPTENSYSANDFSLLKDANKYINTEMEEIRASAISLNFITSKTLNKVVVGKNDKNQWNIFGIDKNDQIIETDTEEKNEIEKTLMGYSTDERLIILLKAVKITEEKRLSAKGLIPPSFKNSAAQFSGYEEDKRFEDILFEDMKRKHMQDYQQRSKPSPL